MTKDELRAQFRKAANVADQVEAPKASNGSQKVFPNRYGGRCDLCGAWVEAEQGQRVRSSVEADKWLTRHLGPCAEETDAGRGDPFVGLPKGTRVGDQIQPKDAGPETPQMAVWPGKYTLEDPGDGGSHITLRVRQQAEDADFAPGETVVGFLSGPDNQSDYTNFGFLSRKGRLSVWKRHRGNGDEPRYVKAARRLVSNPEDFVASRHCFNCNAELTTPESVALGFGPECRKKFGL